MKRRTSREAALGHPDLFCCWLGPARLRLGAEEADEVKLRRWYLGVQGNSGERDQWDVFGQEDLPPAAVVNDGGGGGLLFGYRFGGRFLLGLQLTVTGHDLIEVPEQLYDVEALVTGTVLFRERSTFQPFLGAVSGPVRPCWKSRAATGAQPLWARRPSPGADSRYG